MLILTGVRVHLRKGLDDPRLVVQWVFVFALITPLWHPLWHPNWHPERSVFPSLAFLVCGQHAKVELVQAAFTISHGHQKSIPLLMLKVMATRARTGMIRDVCIGHTQLERT